MNQQTDKAADGGLRTTGLFGLDGCPLHRKTPFGMTNVSMTQLSIARHYGGIKYNGESYTYLPKTDELIRNDVLKWQTKNAKKSLPNVQSPPTGGKEA
jgi:hypothetical protein